MSQVGNIDRTVAGGGVTNTFHENYVREVKPWLDHLSPVAGLFQSLGDGGYELTGEKLVIARDYTYSGGFMGTDGYLPDSQMVDVVRLETTPARLYLRRAVDNFIAAAGAGKGNFEDHMARIQGQAVDAVERGTSFHVHGSSNATVCTFVSRSDADTLVVDAGYGYASQKPTQFVEAGMILALLDANDSFAVIGAAEVDSVTHNTSATTATINFTSDIDTSSTGADGDPLVFATTADESAAHYVAERGKAPNGLLDILDPAASSTTFLGASESTYARWAPTNLASTDFGHVELMEFMEYISSVSNSEVSASSHVLTMNNGVKIELAKDLLPYQQQTQLGRTLQGGWETVRIGEFDVLTDHYHIWDAVYCLCPEDLYVVDLDGEPGVWAGDGNQFNRIADYDGKEWFIKHYVQRFAGRRNNMGALTGVPNPNKERYAGIPA